MPPVSAGSFPVMFKPKPKVQSLAFSMAVPARSSAFACLIALTALAFVAPVHAGTETLSFDTPSKSPVPRWAMLRRNEVYARNGPSKDNRIVWTYHAVSMPVQIISETRDWRLICDPDGGVAWVSKTMLQAQKTVIAGRGRQKLEIHARADANSAVRAFLKPRAMAQLAKCEKGWCKISAGGQTGWVQQADLWGTQTAPVCQRPNLFARN